MPAISMADSCEVCGATYSPTDLIDPYSAVSGAKAAAPVFEHYFFKLSDIRCETFLKNWIFESIRPVWHCSPETRPRLQSEAANKMNEWLSSGLVDWDISRDAPYFGFPYSTYRRQEIFLCLAGCACRLFRQFQELLQAKHSEPRSISMNSCVRAAIRKWCTS